MFPFVPVTAESSTGFPPSPGFPESSAAKETTTRIMNGQQWLDGDQESDEEVVWNGDFLMTESKDDSEEMAEHSDRASLEDLVESLQPFSEDDAQPGTPEFGRPARSPNLDGSDECEREIEKLNAQLVRQTARPEEADQQALQMKTRESTEKERRMEERLQQLCHEVDELRATSSWLTVELQQALGAVDNLELCLQQQIQLTKQLQEQHRMQLEAAEHEFANERIQHQQRLGEMETQLLHQEQKFLARLAIAYAERYEERAELEAAKERHARELHEESLRTQMAHEEAAQLRREIAEVQSALEAADRSREAAEGELQSERWRRRAWKGQASSVLALLQAKMAGKPIKIAEGDQFELV